MTSLVMAAITIFGWVAYERLPVNDLPNIDFPTLTVSASLPGASAETMASAVAMPTVFQHRGRRLDDLGQFARQHADHAAISP